MGRSDLQVFQDVLQYQYCHDGNQEHDRHQSESLIIGFPIPVIFALLLNQVQRSGPRRIIQTISYAPYFMSNVVVVSLISVLFSANGLVNHAVMGAGGKAIMFTSLPEYFRKLFIGSNIWQTMGFNAIIFIAKTDRNQPGILRSKERWMVLPDFRRSFTLIYL